MTEGSVEAKTFELFQSLLVTGELLWGCPDEQEK